MGWWGHMRLGSYEEMPLLRRLCLKHRIILLLAAGPTVTCRRCRSRNGLAAL